MPIFSRTGRAAALTAGALLTGLLAAGCHDEAQPPATTVVNSPSPPANPPAATTTPGAMTGTGTDGAMSGTKINTNAGAGASTGTDTDLAANVNKAIVQNKQMTGARVEPVATAGVVTLNGQVQNQQQKALAEKTASQVPGVSSIKNKLLIVTTGGIKPKPQVITKTKTVVVHDGAPAPTSSDQMKAMSGQMNGRPNAHSDTKMNGKPGSSGSGQANPPASPNDPMSPTSPNPPAKPMTPDTGAGKP